MCFYSLYIYYDKHSLMCSSQQSFLIHFRAQTQKLQKYKIKNTSVVYSIIALSKYFCYILFVLCSRVVVFEHLIRFVVSVRSVKVCTPIKPLVFMECHLCDLHYNKQNIASSKDRFCQRCPCTLVPNWSDNCFFFFFKDCTLSLHSVT